jgi:hypothetical protein
MPNTNNARVIVRRTARRRPDGLNYEVLTAPPGEELTLVARMSAGGDATTYGQTIRDRITRSSHKFGPSKPVEFTGLS